MPELATAIGYRLQPQVFQPIAPSSYFNRQLPVQPDIPVDKAAKAGIFSSLVKALGELPGQLNKEWEAGKTRGEKSLAEDQKRATEKQVRSKFNDAMGGVAPAGSPQLSDFTVGPDGGVTMKAQDPDLVAAKVAHLKQLRSSTAKPSLHEREESSFGVPQASTGDAATGDAAIAPDGGDFGHGTSYAYRGDRYGGPKAKSSTVGMLGTPLDDKSLAVSPDNAERLKKQGYKPGDLVTVHTDKGDTVVRWDDATAQDDPTHTWAVDDKGNKISDGKGGYLPALRGRWDFHATADGKPSPYNGARVLGFSRPEVVHGKPMAKAFADVAASPSEGAAVAAGSPPAGETLIPDGRGGFNVQNAAETGDATELPDDPFAALPSDPEQDPASPALSSFNPNPAASPEQMHQIDAGVNNAVGQLSGLTNDSLTASNAPAGQAAPIQPPAADVPTDEPATPPPSAPSMAIDPATGQPRVEKAIPVMGRTKNHITGNVYLRGENGAVKTYDPITREITMKTADGRHFTLLPGANTWKEEKDISATGTKPSALLIREASGMGINTDGMTNGQVAEAMSNTEKEQGIIRPSRLPVAQSLARLVMGHPTLKHYPTIREAKETVDAGLANQDTGGFGDMALVEGFQRMVNPGATVRSQTMQQMLKGAGLGQYADVGFLIDHFKEGDKFNPETRQRLKKLADAIYKNATKNAKPQLDGLKKLARSYGITDPDSFIDNVMVMTPVLAPGEEAGAAPGTPAAPAAPAAAAGSGKVKMAKPDGTVIYVPADKVEQAKGLGATFAK